LDVPDTIDERALNERDAAFVPRISILNQLFSQKCAVFTGSDGHRIAQGLIHNVLALGTEIFLEPQCIDSGNQKLNMSFGAQLLNMCPAVLDVTGETLSTFDYGSLESNNAGDSREERVFRMWISSLNIPEFPVNNLFEDLHDGIGIGKLVTITVDSDEEHKEPKHSPNRTQTNKPTSLATMATAKSTQATRTTTPSSSLSIASPAAALWL
jgi:hypothetical protein